MKISYFTEEGNLVLSSGYGTAGFNVVRSLQALGHEVPFNDETAPVQIAFCNPVKAKFHDNQYKIIYTPWESTELPHGWLDAFNAADEVWATSQWVADVYRKAGVTRPIYVFHHGIEDVWHLPFKRERGDTLKFLHVGEPALRKGGQMVLDAFMQTFGDRDDVHLTFKANASEYLRVWKDGEYRGMKYAPDNVTVITDTMFLSEMVDLYLQHDVMVYPSYGEGFGFIPLQALATGMPTISTSAWAPYHKFLEPLEIVSRMDRSIWSVHPGDVFYPNFNHLKHNLWDVEQRFNMYSDSFYNQAEQVISEYDWTTLTRDAFEHIVNKFS